MTTISSVLSLAVAAAIAVGTTSTAQAQSTEGVHYIDKLNYQNNGGYVSSIALWWKDPESGKTDKITCNHSRYVGFDPCAVYQDTRTRIDLDKPDRRNLKAVPEGAEVWLVVQIDGGDTESCRKPNAKFFYKKGSKTAARFSTSGTTLDNNRCRFKGEN